MVYSGCTYYSIKYNIAVTLENDSTEEITIKMNMSALQSLLETTADHLLYVFKANRRVPEQPDVKVRENILRELYGIRKALIPRYTKQQLESMTKPAEARCESDIQTNLQRELDTVSESWAPNITQPLVGESEPSTSSLSLNSVANTNLTAVESDSEQESSIAKNESSSKVGQKQSCKDIDLSQPQTKRLCTPMRNSNILSYFGNTANGSGTSRKTGNYATSKNTSMADRFEKKNCDGFRTKSTSEIQFNF